MFYLTYNDPPSGIYFSQVTDVCRFLKNEMNVNIRLVTFISIRGFLKKRKRIKQELSDAMVLPMFPKVINWKLNKWMLFFLCFKMQSHLNFLAMRNFRT